MRTGRGYSGWLGGVLLGLLLLAALPGLGEATTAADVCAFGANACAAGVANINSVTPVTDGSTLDFTTAGFSTVNVNAGGALALEDKNTAQTGGCPANPSPTMTILAGDVVIKNGGSINGDTGAVAGKLTNGGAIYIELAQVGTNTGSLVIEPGGRLSSDRTGGGNGRGGNVTVLAEGQIWVQADVSGTPRGVVSSNTSANSRAAFNQNCGRSQITLVATGTDVAANEALKIDGTVEIRFGGSEAVIGGVTETTKAVLPVLERYGVLTPEAGQYPYRLPFPGEPVSLYGTTGYFRPGEGPAAWAPLLLLGGGALLLFLFAGRRRSR